jgi:uncharacterized protein
VSPETSGFAGVSRLGSAEIRVLGCLLEKQRTTPDQYPLSLNALRLACNQSTNREPVVDYDDAVLRDALHRLERRGYTRLASSGRSPKYRHLLAEALPMEDDEQAVVCVLMLRGPQTPGELKQRSERMHHFADLGTVHETLERLIGRELVACLERRPGQKEERYIQLLQDRGTDAAPPGARESTWERPTGEQDSGERPSIVAPTPGLGGAPGAGAVEDLERRVAHLERELAELRAAQGRTTQGARPEDSTASDPAPTASDPYRTTPERDPAVFER